MVRWPSGTTGDDRVGSVSRWLSLPALSATGGASRSTRHSPRQGGRPSGGRGPWHSLGPREASTGSPRPPPTTILRHCFGQDMGHHLRVLSLSPLLQYATCGAPPKLPEAVTWTCRLSRLWCDSLAISAPWVHSKLHLPSKMSAATPQLPPRRTSGSPSHAAARERKRDRSTMVTSPASPDSSARPASCPPHRGHSCYPLCSLRSRTTSPCWD